MLKRFVVAATLLLATQTYADDQIFKLCKNLLTCGIEYVLHAASVVAVCPKSQTVNLDFITGAGKVLIIIKDYIPDCADPKNLPVTHMMLRDCQKGVASEKELANACIKRISH
jgi:hypothetical protein